MSIIETKLKQLKYKVPANKKQEHLVHIESALSHPLKKNFIQPILTAIITLFACIFIVIAPNIELTQTTATNIDGYTKGYISKDYSQRSANSILQVGVHSVEQEVLHYLNNVQASFEVYNSRELHNGVLFEYSLTLYKGEEPTFYHVYSGFQSIYFENVETGEITFMRDGEKLANLLDENTSIKLWQVILIIIILGAGGLFDWYKMIDPVTKKRLPEYGAKWIRIFFAIGNVIICSILVLIEQTNLLLWAGLYIVLIGLTIIFDSRYEGFENRYHSYLTVILMITLIILIIN